MKVDVEKANVLVGSLLIWPVTVVILLLIFVRGCIEVEKIQAEHGWGGMRHGYQSKPDAEDKP